MKRALHVCPVPKCPELVSGSARYCAKHERERIARYPHKPDIRLSAAARGYGTEWQKIRAAYLARYPRCSFTGCTRPSTDAHHLISPKKGGTHDYSNLQAYCHEHHSQITAKKQPGGFGRRRKVVTDAK